MSLIENSKKSFEQAFWFSVMFSLAFTILNGAINYSMGVDLSYDATTNPNGIPVVTWGSDILEYAVEQFQQGIGINMVVSIPIFAAGLLTLIIQILVNAIALTQYFIKVILLIILQFIILDPSYIATLSSILAWILELPIIVG